MTPRQKLVAPLRPFAIAALCAVVLFEIFVPAGGFDWLYRFSTSWLSWTSGSLGLAKCSAQVQRVKAEHLALFVVLFPLKAFLVYLCIPARFELPDKPLEALWNAFCVTLLSFLGTIPLFVLIDSQWTPSKKLAQSVRSTIVCLEPSTTHLAVSAGSFLFAALCFLPATIVLVYLARKIVVSVLRRR